MSCIVLNFIRAKGYVCTMKCRFTSLSTPTTSATGACAIDLYLILVVRFLLLLKHAIDDTKDVFIVA